MATLFRILAKQLLFLLVCLLSLKKIQKQKNCFPLFFFLCMGFFYLALYAKPTVDFSLNLIKNRKPNECKPDIRGMMAVMYEGS